MKNDRQTAVLQIIEETAVETQEQLMQLLAVRGFACTQATVSRDIKQLHLMKAPDGMGGYRYAVSAQMPKLNFEEKLQTIFRECVVSAENAQNLAVIKTMNGMANAAAFALDSMKDTDIVGTLAGDDTVLLVFHDSAHAADFCEQLVLAAMLSGYLDDSASSPWGNLKKGLIDLAISVMAAVTYLHYNPNTFDLAFFGKTVTLNPIIYAILIIILIWVSINVTNCSDGVDGLCGTLSVVTLASVYVLFKSFNIESAYRHTVLIMIVCILGYLWFNASPSKLLMGDAGSRAIGIFIAFTFLKLHAPLLYIPMALVIILDGGLGLIKVSFMRFLHINLMKNLRTPIHDHMRKNKDWSDTQVVFRFTIIQVILGLAVIYGLMF